MQISWEEFSGRFFYSTVENFSLEFCVENIKFRAKIEL